MEEERGWRELVPRAYCYCQLEQLVLSRWVTGGGWKEGVGRETAACLAVSSLVWPGSSWMPPACQWQRVPEWELFKRARYCRLSALTEPRVPLACLPFVDVYVRERPVNMLLSWRAAQVSGRRWDWVGIGWWGRSGERQGPWSPWPPNSLTLICNCI